MSVDLSMTEVMEVAKAVHDLGAAGRPLEAYFAIYNGWKRDEFHRLYISYIESTQVDLATVGNDTTGAKGNPLEEVARYFLEKGGIARNVKPGGVRNKWTVDGIGETYPDRLSLLLDADASKKCGAQLYLEAKNHADVMGPDEWAQHGMRMRRHQCTLGIVISTAGFPMTHGKGYADEPYHDWLVGVIHILLSVADLRKVDVDGELPWSVVRTAYLRLVNQGYETVDVQKEYSKKECIALAASESIRLKAA